ncbi:hypothetical protein [Spirosoma aerolatum]|uniref:hypothetical protein n=1 Tax=Spirosoma aerolatum TaxID=1211326 RepID=UPI0009AF06F9|nr:hypothetical protein [Spirosoma aerolatum]
MKPLIRLSLTLLAVVFVVGPLHAQNSAGSAWAGQLSYEGVRKIDPNSMRININGEDIKPGDPRFPTDIPDTRVFGLKTQIASHYAKEVRDEQNAVIQVRDGNGPPQTRTIPRPFTEQVFVDLSGLKKVTVLTVGKDADAKVYQAEAPIQRVSGWQLTDQTKKIAGYTCRKATIPYKKETYTVWITNELPFTYSPIHELTPDSGVVLLVEGSREQFKATKVDASGADANAVVPTAKAQTVTPEQLTDLRQKAIADFQQQIQLNDRN